MATLYLLSWLSFFGGLDAPLYKIITSRLLSDRHGTIRYENPVYVYFPKYYSFSLGQIRLGYIILYYVRLV